MNTKERQLNLVAYRRLKDGINKTYPCGRFIAIAAGAIIGDAVDLRELRSTLQSSGVDPDEALYVRSGDDYPEKGIILLNRTTL